MIPADVFLVYANLLSSQTLRAWNATTSSSALSVRDLMEPSF